jgi:hypothetical protein
LLAQRKIWKLASHFGNLKRATLFLILPSTSTPPPKPRTYVQHQCVIRK